MATIPVQATVNPGFKLTASGWNDDVRDSVNFCVDFKPIFNGTQTISQSIPTGTFTDILLDSEIVDRDGQHSTASNTARCVIGNTLGFYYVSGIVAWNGGGGTFRRGRIALNGAGVVGTFSICAPAGTGFTTAPIPGVIVQATNSTDYLTLQGAHDTGANLGTAISGDLRSSLVVQWVGR